MNDLSDQKLDELLRQNFAGVPDHGFSKRVLRALPQRPSPRIWLLPAAAVIGGLLTWLALLPSPIWQAAASELLTRDAGATSLMLSALLFGVSLLGCAWALEEA